MMSEKLFDFGVDIPTKITEYTKRFVDLEGFLDEDYDGEHHMLWDNQDECWICLYDVLCLMEKEYVNIKEENEKLQKENEKIQEEIKELKIERDDWKSSTCNYMNKDSILSMDCQIVREALWELEKEIEFGSKREDLFFDLKEKFEKLNNHRIGVYE